MTTRHRKTGQESTRTSLASGLAIVFFCFFLSGATGLIYEVIWLRLLGLVFGHTVYAITTVLAAFMAGLALGSLLFARLAARIRNLIATYGWLEIGIGLSCALVPLLLGLEARVYLGLHRALHLSYDAFSLVQFLLVFALLLIPTTLMGGTLPILSQALVRQETELGRKVGALYAINTFGAVVGVVAAGYVLLPALGNRRTIAIAVVANFVVGALAIAYSRTRSSFSGQEASLGDSRAVRAQTSPGSGASDAGASGPLAPGARLTILALGISGAASMIYEVAWTRALALVIGSSTYAFTAMLVAFLVGIAGGSALYSRLLGNRRASPRTFAAIQIALAAVVTITMLSFERMPELFLSGLGWSESPVYVQLIQFVVSASSLLPSTLLIGATFPCAVAVAARVARVGEDVGKVYAVNTLGAIVGTVLAGFVLIPAIGVHASLKVGITINLLVGAGLALLTAGARSKPAWRWGSLGAALAATAGIVAIPAWNPSVMSSGPAVYGKAYLRDAAQRSLGQVLRSSQVLFYRDGRSGTISVTQTGPYVYLRTNGKMDAGTEIDMATQLMSGHLPMLMHPDPRKVLVIGMGSGITAGSMARYPIESLDLVEIEPAVLEASRFFAQFNGNVLADPRVRPVIADGRNFLLTTPSRYDVIVSEPSNPWIGGLASLFSVEFFRMARERLQPGGMMLQWIQGYNLSPEDLQMVVRTFRAVFPSTTIWNTIRGDFLLLGRTETKPFDLLHLQNRYTMNPAVWRDFDRFGIRAWPGILGYFMLGTEDTARYTEGTALNDDDRLPLEFSAPRALYTDTTEQNWALIRGFRTVEFPDVTAESKGDLDRPDVRYWIGVGYLSRDVSGDALSHFERALQLDPGYVPAMLGVAVVHLRARQPSLTIAIAQQVLARDPANADAFYLAGLATEALNGRAQAAALLERAVALQPQNQDFQAALTRVSRGGGTP